MKEGEKEATLVSLFVFRQQREPSEQRKKLNDFTFEIMTSRQRVGADGSLGGHLSELCIFMCAPRLEELLNDCVHWSHLKGFSPV